MKKIQLPYNGWDVRDYQCDLWEYLMSGGKRAMAVWHRRAGKDDIALHYSMISMWTRIGNVWHCLPEFLQGRKAIWTAVNPHTGKRRIDEAFPHELRENVNDNEMFIRFKNGSTWQVIGSDRYNATMGAGVMGITYSEWALANPSAWAYHRPIIEENGGWALFITTPRGRNHAYDMMKHASQTPGWFFQTLTARDTGTLTDEQLAESLAEYKTLYGEDVGNAQFRQEYFCDWNSAILGAFYAAEMAAVRAEGRIGPIVAQEGVPVHRAWDLGVSDDTSIWWFQRVGAQLFILDHYANSNTGVDHYAEVIEERRTKYGWKDGDDLVPPDAKVREWGNRGRTRISSMIECGLHPLLVPDAKLMDGIQAVRRTLPLCVFHPRCEATGIAALEQYRRSWDDERKCFNPIAEHDWTSHPADSFRYLSVGWRNLQHRVEEAKPRIPTGFYIPPPAEPRRGIIL